jgi:hypothetical protein
LTIVHPTLLKWFRLRGFGQGTHYRGIYRDVINTVTLGDVAWACGMLGQLSEQQ